MLRWIRWLINVVLVLAILLLLLLLATTIYFRQSVAIVLSSSMEPALPRSALAFTRVVEPEEVEVGDIIAFSPEESPDLTTSHRVIEVVSDGGKLSFRTKGDANEDADLWLVPSDYVRGKVYFHLPGLGRVINIFLFYVRTWWGLVFFITVPSLLVVFSTVRGLLHPTSRRQKRLDLLRKRRRRWRWRVIW